MEEKGGAPLSWIGGSMPMSQVPFLPAVCWPALLPGEWQRVGGLGFGNDRGRRDAAAQGFEFFAAQVIDQGWLGLAGELMPGSIGAELQKSSNRRSRHG